MANGIIELTRFGDATNATLYGRMVWSSVSDGTAANTSTVTVEVQLKRPANSWTSGTWRGTITIGGTASDFAQYLRVEEEWITVAKAAVTVSHNADGSCACYLYCKVNGPGATSMEGSYVTGSSTVTLDKIPRYASIISVSNFTDESNPLITYSNPAGTAVSSLQVCISLDGTTEKTAYKDVPKTGTEFSMPLTEAERNTLRAATPNSNTLPVYFILKTVIGSGSEVSSKTAKMNIVGADPTISASVVDTSSVTSGVTGNTSILVANQSTARVTLTATAKKYASIVSRRIEHGATVLTDNGSFAVTNNPIKLTTVDSRGNQTTQNAANTIVPYINPTCVIGNDLPETDGSYKLSVSGVFYNGYIGKTANSLTVQYRYKAAGGSYGSWYTFGSVSKSGNTYSATANITGLDYQTVYTFQVRTIDAIHTSGVIAERAVISEPVFDWGQNDFKFNVPVHLKYGCDILKNGTVAYAPGGYGLGEATLFSMADIDNKTKPGWYYCNESAAIAGFTTNRWWMLVKAYGTGTTFATQEITTFYGTRGLKLERHKINGTWQGWEWINPPMISGVEYRTTKRYNSKPVYCKYISIGALPNNTVKSVTFTSESDTVIRPISVTGTYGSSESTQHMTLPSNSHNAVLSYQAALTCVNYRQVRVVTNFDASPFVGFALVKYWKTTD